MAKMPPVPPASRSPKGPGGIPKAPADDTKESAAENGEEEREQEIIKRNTSHKGQGPARS